jgi:L,D-transpeptidase catalytic domain
MRGGSALSTIVLCTVAVAGDAEAKLDLYIDKSTQQMSVIRNGALLYAWPVSTGQDRFSTPSGVYTPERLEPMWYSKAYYNAPMPHAIFFHHGYAIHGSYDITQLGGPASHGCVRLHPEEAALLFAMVEREGPSNTTIVVGGGPPAPLPPRYRDLDEPPRPPYVRDHAIPPGTYLPNPGMPPYSDPYHYVDGPERRRGDDSRSPMREAYPNRPPPPRPDAQMPMEPMLPPNRGYGPPVSRFDAQVAMEPPPGAGGRYRPPPPRPDAQVAMEPPPGAGARYRPPPPRPDAQLAMEPPPGAGARYRAPPPRPDAQIPMEPPPGAGARYRAPPPRPDAQIPMEPTVPPRRGYGPPASRFDAAAPIEPTLPPRGRDRPPAPTLATAKSNSKCPTCGPNHAADESANRNASAGHPAKSPSPPSSSPSPLSASMQLPSAPSGSTQAPWPPSALAQSAWPPSASTQPSPPPSASPPPPLAQPASSPSASPSPPAAAASPTASPSSESAHSGLRYRVLPQSYWTGASWRWRLKAEHEISTRSLTPDAQ